MKIETNLRIGAACYVVQPGDTLSSIAKTFYGVAGSTQLGMIYYSNQATIGPNPYVILPGQTLYIPS